MRQIHKLQTIRTTPAIVDSILKNALIFLVAGSFALILIATYGLDLSAGFF